MNFRIIFKALTLIPLLIGSVNALYDTVKRIDDDPEIKQAFDTLKSNVRVAGVLQTIKVQVAVIKGYLKQLQ